MKSLTVKERLRALLEGKKIVPNHEGKRWAKLSEIDGRLVDNTGTYWDIDFCLSREDVWHLYEEPGDLEKQLDKEIEIALEALDYELGSYHAGSTHSINKLIDLKIKQAEMKK